MPCGQETAPLCTAALRTAPSSSVCVPCQLVGALGALGEGAESVGGGGDAPYVAFLHCHAHTRVVNETTAMERTGGGNPPFLTASHAHVVAAAPSTPPLAHLCSLLCAHCSCCGRVPGLCAAGGQHPVVPGGPGQGCGACHQGVLPCTQVSGASTGLPLGWGSVCFMCVRSIVT